MDGVGQNYEGKEGGSAKIEETVGKDSASEARVSRGICTGAAPAHQQLDRGYWHEVERTIAEENLRADRTAKVWLGAAPA